MTIGRKTVMVLERDEDVRFIVRLMIEMLGHEDALDGMDVEGTEEFFNYNVDGSRISASSPIFLRAC
jgi:hypothetical protein